MHFTGQLFLHYGYPIMFAWVLLEQLGIPLPSTPILLTAGTLTATHQMKIGWIVLAVITASAISDSIWFRLGSRYGSSVTHWICKFSFEAATCVRRTEDMLMKNGPTGLLLAKFIPGLNTMAAPLAGQSKMRYRTFLLYDIAGTFMWVTSIVIVGRFFGDAIRRNNGLLHWMGRSAFVLVLLVIAGILIYKFLRQRAFLQTIRTLRIEPGELKAMIDRGEFFEWSTVYGELKGRTFEALNRSIASGKDTVIKIDVQGAEKVRERTGGDGVYIFLLPPSLEALEQRLIERGTEDPGSLRERHDLAVAEIALKDTYDHQVVNDDAKRAAREIESIIAAARLGQGDRS